MASEGQGGAVPRQDVPGVKSDWETCLCKAVLADCGQGYVLKCLVTSSMIK